MRTQAFPSEESLVPPTITGIKPTGLPHPGNYLDMIRPALDLARTSDLLCFIADYHALTTLPPPDSIREAVLDLGATLIAFGLDPERTVLYRQSDAPEICELTWILSCVAQKGLLNRAHAYKAAVQENLAAGRDRDQGVGMGLFNYPILMAADILIHRGPQVPGGRGRLCRGQDAAGRGHPEPDRAGASPARGTHVRSGRPPGHLGQRRDPGPQVRCGNAGCSPVGHRVRLGLIGRVGRAGLASGQAGPAGAGADSAE